MNYEVFDRDNIDYLEKILLDQEGNLRVHPYEIFKDIEPNHIKQFCAEQGVYCLPTKELIDFLRNEIEAFKTLEIGAGHGVIGRELGIPSTDSMLQRNPEIKSMYQAMGQAIVNYGKNVMAYDAETAIRKFHPECVIAAWVTHKYNHNQHYREGNKYGVKEEWILNRVKRYIFVGNTQVHRLKPILDRHHTSFEPEWLISRVYKKPGCKDVIWIWEGSDEN